MSALLELSSYSRGVSPDEMTEDGVLDVRCVNTIYQYNNIHISPGTLLQSLNTSSKMQNEGPNTNSARSNEREVTDPITHLPIQIHDSTSIELEQIPPPNSDSKATEGMDKKQVNNQRHVGMEQVVRDEMTKGRWEEVDSDRTRLAVVAAVSVSIGGYSTLILSKIFGRLFGSGGSESSGVVDFLIASVGCTLLAVAAASIVLYHDTTKEETVQGNEVCIVSSSNHSLKLVPETMDETFRTRKARKHRLAQLLPRHSLANRKPCFIHRNLRHA